MTISWATAGNKSRGMRKKRPLSDSINGWYGHNCGGSNGYESLFNFKSAFKNTKISTLKTTATSYASKEKTFLFTAIVPYFKLKRPKIKNWGE